jgi:hypothetical protein
MSNYAQATAPTTTAYQFHVIREGDTLEKIAQQYNMGTAGVLRNFNASLGDLRVLEGYPENGKSLRLGEVYDDEPLDRFKGFVVAVQLVPSGYTLVENVYESGKSVFTLIPDGQENPFKSKRAHLGENDPYIATNDAISDYTGKEFGMCSQSPLVVHQKYDQAFRQKLLNDLYIIEVYLAVSSGAQPPNYSAYIADKSRLPTVALASYAYLLSTKAQEQFIDGKKSDNSPAGYRPNVTNPTIDQTLKYLRLLAPHLGVHPDQVSTLVGGELTESLRGYFIARNIDEWREQIRMWSPALERKLLDELQVQITLMPASVVGISTGVARSAFQFYHRSISERQAELSRRAEVVELYDDFIAERKLKKSLELPFLLELGLSILFEPIDWLLTLRDLFVFKNPFAIIGFAPLIPAVIFSRPAGTALNEVVEKAWKDAVDQLTASGVKFTLPDLTTVIHPEIKHVAEVDGVTVPKTFFLEVGKHNYTTTEGSGLVHIIARHQDDFSGKLGLHTESEIIDFIINLINKAEPVDIEFRLNPRNPDKPGLNFIYEIEFGGEKVEIVIGVGDNGYIVTAYPRDPKKGSNP